MKTIQMQVSEWARATFPMENIPQKVLHLWKEIEEMFAEASPNVPAMKEAADCAMILMNTAYDLGVILPEPSKELGEHILQKLEINKARKWGQGSDGAYQHVEEPEIGFAGGLDWDAARTNLTNVLEELTRDGKPIPAEVDDLVVRWTDGVDRSPELHAAMMAVKA